MRDHQKQYRRAWLQLIVVSCLSGVALAQNYLTSTGTPAFSTPEPAEYGFIDTANGNLHLQIPLGSYPQRGSSKPEPVLFTYEANNVWAIAGVNPYWLAQGGWTGVSGSQPLSGQVIWVADGPPNGQGIQCAWDGTYVEPSGTQHPFPPNGAQPPGTIGCSSVTKADALATDSSGYHLYQDCSEVKIPACFIQVYAPDGTMVYTSWPTMDSQGHSILLEDANGNYISGTSGTNGPQPYYDTLGRQLGVHSGSVTSDPNSQGTVSNYTINRTWIPVYTNFGQPGVMECQSNCMMYVVQSITLPDNSTFSFTYDCDSTTGNTACSSPGGQGSYYGMLTSMTMPTGGQVTYSWNLISDPYSNKHLWLSPRISAGGTWSYTTKNLSMCSSSQVGCQQQITATNPSDDYSVYTFTLDNGDWPVQVLRYNKSKVLFSTVNTAWDFTNACPWYQCHGHVYVRRLSETTTYPIPPYGTNITKKTTYTYDSPQNGNVSAVKQWKFQLGTNPTFPATSDRATYSTYYNAGTNIINKPLSITVCNNIGTDSDCLGGGSKVAQTKITYDSYGSGGLVSITGIMNHDDTSFGVANTIRGNPTQLQKWISGTTYLSTSRTYDTTGQVLTGTDPAGNMTTYSYTDSFFNDNGSNPPQAYTSATPTNAYPTKITLPIVNGVAMSVSAGYYFGSGQRALLTDVNNNTAYYHFVDPFDRPTGRTFPAGWDLTVYTSPTQADTYTVVNDQTASTTCTSCRHNQFVFDTFSRKTTDTLFIPDGTTDNVHTTYDTSSRISQVSHACLSTSGCVYEGFGYDPLNRPTGMSHPDLQTTYEIYGANVLSYGGLSTQQLSTGTYGYGYPVLVIDETSKVRQEWIDGFGNVIEADEPSGSSGLGNSPNATGYTYDAQDRLIGVAQGVQTRAFTYDGLGRATSVSTPEGHTDSFVYDVDTSCPQPNSFPGNLVKKLDARGIRTCYQYDTQNRTSGKNYSNGQGSVAYQYDQGGALQNALGRLTTLTDPSGSEVYSYDSGGRLTQLQKTIGSAVYTIGYQYYADGQIKQITYPSGRVIKNNISNIGRLSSIVDTYKNTSITRASNYSYSGSGQLLSFQYANGVTANFTYDPNRDYLTSLKYVKGSTTLFSLQYYYALDPTNCPAGTATSNGAINCIVDVVDSGRSVAYTYDWLGRLSSALTTGDSTYPQWGLAWSYDRYGNRLSQTITAGSAYSNNLTFSSSGGALTNQPDGMCFDASGNLLAESSCPPMSPPTYTYDADNRMLTYTGSSQSAQYVYDDNGRRVEKCLPSCTSPSSWTVYVFAAGQDIAEYDNGAVSSNPSREYVYSGEALISKLTSTTTTYYHADHLSVRLSTGTGGAKAGEQGHYPFGESWYSTNTTTKFIFTSYERDSESGHDYAQQRYYHVLWGRFCSADPVSGIPGDPQTWDRYVYARNDPIDLTDPTGLSWLSGFFQAVVDFFVGAFLPTPSPVTPPFVAPTSGNDPWTTLQSALNPPLPNGGIIDESGGFGQGFEPGSGPTGPGSPVPDYLRKTLADLLKHLNLEKKPCAKDLRILGITADDVTNGINSANLINGIGSNVPLADAYKNTPAYAAAQANDAGKTIGSDLEDPNTRATSDLLGNNVYIDPNKFKPDDPYGNDATLFHEIAVHNVAGLTDEAAEAALFPKQKKYQPSDEITRRLKADCIK